MDISDIIQSLQITDTFRQFFLPFLITFAILWGILSAMRVFNRKINLILSLGITIAAGYGGLFTWMATYLFELGAYVGVAAFFIVFVIGAAAWAFGRSEDMISPGRRARKIREKIEKLYEKARNTDSDSKRRAYVEEARRLEIDYEVARRRGDRP